MRNRIFGAIGVIWGGAVLLSSLFKGEMAAGAYGAGQVAALIFGGLLFAVGLYYLFRGAGPTRPRPHRR